MARKPRLEHEGAFYHVLSRGVYKADLFLDDEDYRTFLAKLKEYKQRYLFKESRGSHLPFNERLSSTPQRVG